MEKLKEMRLAKGLTQEEVAEKLGISQEVVSQYETGKRSIKLDLAKRFAELYECNVDDF